MNGAALIDDITVDTIVESVRESIIRGALLDLGVYPATYAWLALGRPDERLR